MTRVFLTIILPLLLPTALYVAWTVGAGRFHAAPLREVPWVWLAFAGVVLALAILASVVEMGGAKDGIYVPPHLENGAVVPGRVAPETGH